MGDDLEEKGTIITEVTAVAKEFKGKVHLLLLIVFLILQPSCSSSVFGPGAIHIYIYIYNALFHPSL